MGHVANMVGGVPGGGGLACVGALVKPLGRTRGDKAPALAEEDRGGVWAGRVLSTSHATPVFCVPVLLQFNDRETPLNAPAMKPEGWLWMLEKDTKGDSQQ